MSKVFPGFFIYLSTITFAYSNCHPKIDNHLRQYIIGYGSLMDETSKRKTSTKVGNNAPLFLQGFERAWNLPTPKGTYLGVVYQAKNILSAVYFDVTPQSLDAFDWREAGYCRVLLDSNQFIPVFSHQTFPKGQYWIYIPEHPKTHAEHIPEYYLDLFTQSCKKIAQDYQNPAFLESCNKIIPKNR